MRPLSFFCSPSASSNDRLSTPSSFTRLQNDSHSPPVRQYVSADSADRYMVFAQDSFLRNCDRWIYPSRFGTAMANRMLRMTSVTASSTRVKPPFPRRFPSFFIIFAGFAVFCTAARKKSRRSKLRQPFCNLTGSLRRGGERDSRKTACYTLLYIGRLCALCRAHSSSARRRRFLSRMSVDLLMPVSLTTCA